VFTFFVGKFALSIFEFEGELLVFSIGVFKFLGDGGPVIEDLLLLVGEFVFFLEPELFLTLLLEAFFLQSLVLMLLGLVRFFFFSQV
jgi:hypothetical protein